MAEFTATAQGYQAILRVQRALRSANIECGITVGGLWVVLSPDQIPLAKQVCQDAGGSLDCGPTAQMQEVVLQDKDGWESVKRSTNDAIAVMQEWEE